MTHWDDKVKFFNNGCPFCKCQNFGGLSINFACKKCKAKFNDMGPFGIDLLSRPVNNNLVQKEES